MRFVRALAVPLVAALAAVPAVSQTQTDWSAGPGVDGPVAAWASSFANADGIAWRSIPGQVALRSFPRATPLEHLVADDAGLPLCVGSGDVDGDGRDDVVSTDAVYDVFGKKGAIYWWRSLPAGGFSAAKPVTLDFYGAHYVATADVDRDGDLDVIAAAYYGVVNPPPPPPTDRNGRFAWFENLRGDGSTWQQHVVGQLFWGANWIDAGDLDGDGDIDLVGASELANGVYEQDADLVWFENLDGSGDTWSMHSVDDDFPNASEAHMADLDGDGDLDVVGAHQPDQGSSQFHWWENLAGNAGSWARHDIPGSFSGSGYLDIGDIDNDGDLDLIGSGLLSGSLGWWENLAGDASSWASWSVSALPNGRVIHLVDADGDGDLDAMASTGLGGPNSGSAWWIENVTGPGTTWMLRNVRKFLDGNPWIAPGDVDGDGKPDAVVSDENIYSPYGKELEWMDITTFASAGDLESSILDGGPAAHWGFAAWDARIPAGTSLALEVRVADDPADLGNYVAVPEPGVDLATLIDPGARYLQYRFDLAGDEVAGSPVVRQVGVDALYQLAPVPARGGVVNTFVARWGHPGQKVRFYGSPRRGGGTVAGCPQPLGLDQPLLLGEATADAAGEARFQRLVPIGANGRTLYFQALAPATCTLGNRVEQPFGG